MTDLTPDVARARAERLQARVLNGTATRADVDWLVETIETLEAALDAERARREEVEQERDGWRREVQVVSDQLRDGWMARAEAAEACNRNLEAVAEAAQATYELLDEFLHLGRVVSREEWYAARDSLRAALAVLEEPQ